MTEGNQIAQNEVLSPMQQWKKGLELKSKTKTLSLKTWEQCQSAMRNYLVYLAESPTGPRTPEELIAEATADITTAETHLARFFNWLQGELVEGVTPRKECMEAIDQRRVNPETGKKFGRALTPALSYSSARNMAYSRLAGFYSHNRLRLPPRITPAARTSQVAVTDDLHSVMEFDEETDQRSMNYSGLRDLMNQLGHRDRTIFMCIFASSQDPKDVFSLTVGWVRQQLAVGKKRFFWSGTRSKTQEPFKTFLSKRTVEMITQYVETDRADATDEEPLFVKRNGRLMNTTMLDKIFREAQDRMGIANNGTHSPYRPKRLRHIFRSICGLVNIDPGYAHCFMGHKSGISSGYLGKDRAELESIYVKLEPYLDPFRTTVDDDMAEMRKKHEGFSDELLSQSRELREAKELIEAQGKKIEELTAVVHDADFLVNKLVELGLMPPAIDLESATDDDTEESE